MAKLRNLANGITSAVRLGLAVVGLAALFLAAMPVSTCAAETIRAIRVEGAERFASETVKSYLAVSEGDAFDDEKLRQSLKSLFDTGFFKDAALAREGGTLVVRVQENPLVYKLTFEGSESLEQERLEELVRTREGDTLVQGRVERDLAMIRQALRIKGMFQAKVETDIVPLPQNRVHLTYRIFEGSTSKVRDVRFVGNQALKQKELLKKLLIQPTGWLSWWTEDDTYDRDKLLYDQEQLREKYLNAGFARVRVLSSVAEMTPDRKAFVVTHTVEEGPRFNFGAITLSGDVTELSEEDLRRELVIRSGDTYSRDHLRQSIENLTDRVGDLGYAFVDVNPQTTINDDTQTVDVSFKISKGKRVYLNRIEVSGNTRTRDEVIRREMGKLVEGNTLSTSEVRKSKRRLEALSFFETVEISNPPMPEFPDRSDLHVKVEEKNTGAFTIGAGYSSYESLLGIATIYQNNFLGRGQKMKVSFALSSMRSDFEVSFVEPYFMNKNMAAGVTIFNQDHQQKRLSSYNLEAFGVNTFLAFNLSDRLTNTISYSLSNIELSSPYDEAYFSPALQSAFAASPYWKSMISDSLTWSSIDNPLLPTDGRIHKLGVDVAGLGGDLRFIRAITEHGVYHPLTEKSGLVAHLKGRIGFAEGFGGDDVPIFERFMLGGSRTIRGFDPGGIGPRNTRGDAYGGTFLAQINAELLFPIIGLEEHGVRGLTFLDMGTLGDSGTLPSDVLGGEEAIRVSTGVGLQWQSPFGPLQLHLGVPLKKEDFDKTRVFDFTIGTTL